MSSEHFASSIQQTIEFGTPATKSGLSMSAGVSHIKESKKKNPTKLTLKRLKSLQNRYFAHIKMFSYSTMFATDKKFMQ